MGEWSQVPGIPRPPCPHRALTITGEVLHSHILDGDLSEEEGLLAPGIPAHDAFPPEPPAEPGQVAVAVEWVGQEVSGGERGGGVGHGGRPRPALLVGHTGPGFGQGMLSSFCDPHGGCSVS
jgi:hypothetical protein